MPLGVSLAVHLILGQTPPPGDTGPYDHELMYPLRELKCQTSRLHHSSQLGWTDVRTITQVRFSSGPTFCDLIFPSIQVVFHQPMSIHTMVSMPWTPWCGCPDTVVSWCRVGGSSAPRARLHATFQICWCLTPKRDGLVSIACRVCCYHQAGKRRCGVKSKLARRAREQGHNASRKLSNPGTDLCTTLQTAKQAPSHQESHSP